MTFQVLKMFESDFYEVNMFCLLDCKSFALRILCRVTCIKHL